MKLTAHRLLATAGIASRRALRRQIRYLIGPDGSKLSLDASIELNAQWQAFELREVPFWVRIAPPPLVAYHKRLDEVVSRRADGGAQPVFEIVEAEIPRELIAVGRLDRDTTGLLIFTTDGTLVHRLTHPKYGIERTYVATTSEPLPPEALTRATSDGVALRDGHVTRPARMVDLGDARYEVVLQEGKYHEVRRLCAALGSEVVALERRSYGSLELADLPLGAVERIEDERYAALYEAVGLSVPEPELDVSFELPEGASSVASSQGSTGI